MIYITKINDLCGPGFFNTEYTYVTEKLTDE